MLTYEDESTIRNAILKRIGKEPGVKIADIIIQNMPKSVPPHIRVGVWCVFPNESTADFIPDTRSFFDLPASFDYKHLHNEIDEIAEACKKARIRARAARVICLPGVEYGREAMMGTGARGRWNVHA